MICWVLGVKILACHTFKVNISTFYFCIHVPRWKTVTHIAIQRQTAITACFSSKLLLPFSFALQCCVMWSVKLILSFDRIPENLLVEESCKITRKIRSIIDVCCLWLYISQVNTPVVLLLWVLLFENHNLHSHVFWCGVCSWSPSHQDTPPPLFWNGVHWHGVQSV